ncbi:cobyric acid synthase [Bacillus sp. FJAT-45350]|uniref:cobyric acid synthase n=1 Tax=Bacillus sp. FJAT-45350 TaxID=2011014 RepID=UPI000BB918E1|nr:cobyric acid synthase [Bacillus sp. FJAT-45350]
MKGIMLQGTSSDVGKSVLCTALCRIFSRKEMKIVPFKSQNMSNNSYVTIDGKEIGRAQGIQAEAAKVEASVYMNPILLKPRSDRDSEVVRFGVSYESLSGKDYRQVFYEKGIETIKQSLTELEKNFDYLVIEGAGSPVEINLNDREIVNMKVAELADVPVILVADIDRGGVFASIVGTLSLLSKEERRRVVGVIINKFRGDESLFASGVEWIEKNTGVKVVGVVPHIGDLTIEGEDSLSMKNQFTNSKGEIDIAVIDLPYVSNYTDLEPFRFEDDVSIRFVSDKNQLGTPDAIIIPGTKSTFHDLAFIKDRGLAELIQRCVTKGVHLIGLCGGYQMLGKTLVDKAGTDTGVKGATVEGLNIAPLFTYFQDKKTTIRSTGNLVRPVNGIEKLKGFEIHLGQTSFLEKDTEPFLMVNGKEEGVYLDGGQIIGTYFHHLFHNDQWRTYWLNGLREKKGLTLRENRNLQGERDLSYERLADHVEKAIDVEYLLSTLENWTKQNVN